MFSKRIAFFLVVATAFAPGCVPCDLEGAEVPAAWVQNSYDLSMVDRLFLTDSRVTYFSSEKEGLITGIETVREHHREFGFVEGGKEQDNRLWVEELHTSVFGPTAIVTGIWFFTRGEGTDVEPQRGPFTIVYVPAGDDYRIAHMHFANYQ